MAISTDTTTELTTEQVRSTLVQPLQAASVFLAAGPRIFDTASQLRIPKAPQPDPAGIEWHGENEQITEADPDFDEVTLMPSTLQSLKVLTRYSNELARQSVVNLEAAIRQRLVSDVAARLDQQLLSADGDGVTQPRGLFAYEGTQTVNVAGPLDLDAMLEAQGLALEADAAVESSRWLIRPSDLTALRKLTDNDGRHLLQPDPTQGTIGTILGNRVILSSRIPEGRAAFADFGQIAVARDSEARVKVLSETFGDFDQQALRVVTRYDADALNPAAVVTLDGIGAA